MPRYGHNRLQLIGKEFGNLIVIAAAPNTAAGKSRWVCMCICGNEHIAYGSHLRNGKTTSCGHSPVYCVHGHLRVPENIYPDGTCKECQKVVVLQKSTSRLETRKVVCFMPRLLLNIENKLAKEWPLLNWKY